MATPFFNDAVGSTVIDLPSANARIYFLKLVNTAGATAYLQMFRKRASAVVLGTTRPDWVIRLANGESAVVPMHENPAELGTVPLPSVVSGSQTTGLSMAGTTTPTGAAAAVISVSALVT